MVGTTPGCPADAPFPALQALYGSRFVRSAQDYANPYSLLNYDPIEAAALAAHYVPWLEARVRDAVQAARLQAGKPVA